MKTKKFFSKIFSIINMIIIEPLFWLLAIIMRLSIIGMGVMILYCGIMMIIHANQLYDYSLDKQIIFPIISILGIVVGPLTIIKGFVSSDDNLFELSF